MDKYVDMYLSNSYISIIKIEIVVKNPTIALIYDFDGTLSPGNMQEFGFIQATGMTREAFWRKNKEIVENQDANSILCYMKLMLDEARHSRVQLTRDSFKNFGKKVKLYSGVKEWFDLIDQYGANLGLNIEHYINSSGLKEIIEGTEIAKYFKQIYACSFMYDANNVAEWPAVAVDFTAKTQVLYMINKGIENVKDNHLVNKYQPEEERPIPFGRMIYFGDGETDIPCMRMVKANGGYSIAVHKPRNKEKRKTANKLIIDNRVNFVCPADYTQKGEIYKTVTTILDKIKSDYEFENLKKHHIEKAKSNPKN